MLLAKLLYKGLYHPERLAAPQMMSGGRFVDTTWGDVWERLGALTKDTNKIGIIAAVQRVAETNSSKVPQKMGASEKTYTYGNLTAFILQSTKRTKLLAKRASKATQQAK